MTVAVHRRSEVALHEAGHVAAAIILRGRLPLRVTADRPETGLAGRTHFDLSDDGIDERPLDFMLVNLGGMLADSTPIPAWPLEPGDGITSSDEQALATLASYLELTEADWVGVVDRARRLAESEDFNHLVGLVARALELKDELDADDLQQLIPRRLRLKYLEEVHELCNT
jgi:hypothetical protein